jgi:hypothetical protein
MIQNRKYSPLDSPRPYTSSLKTPRRTILSEEPSTASERVPPQQDPVGNRKEQLNALEAEAERELMALRKEQESAAPSPEPEEADVDNDDTPDDGAPPKSVFRLMPWMKLK